METNFPSYPWPFILLAITTASMFSSWTISKAVLSINDSFKKEKKLTELDGASAARKAVFEAKYDEFCSSHNKLILLLICNNVSSIGLAFLILLHIFIFLINKGGSCLDYFIFSFLFLFYLSIAITIMTGKKHFGIKFMPPNGRNGEGGVFVDPLDELPTS